MGKRAKRHHIVPQILQKQFGIRGDEQRVWRTKRDEDSERFQALERKLIKNTFVINDYYTVLENDQRSDVIERKFYGPIDNYLGNLLPQVLRILEARNIPDFSSEALESIRQVVMHMAKRTPDFLAYHDDIEMGRKLVEDTLKYDLGEIPDSYRKQLEADLMDTARLKDRGRDIRVTATLENSTRINEALSEFVPRWAISQTKHSYILASRMVYRIGNGASNGLINPNMEMWMPISPKIALVLLRDPDHKIPHLMIDTPTHIRRVNEYAVKNSFEVASHSEALLKSLLRR